MTTQNAQSLNFRVSDDVYEEIKKIANETGQTASQVARTMLKKGIDEDQISKQMGQQSDSELPLFYRQLVFNSIKTQKVVEDLARIIAPKQYFEIMEDASEMAKKNFNKLMS